MKAFGSGGRKKPGRNKNWVKDVKTVSTFPPEGLYKQDAKTIAEVMAKPEVSPKGLVSAIQMVQFYINRAGRKLPEERRQVLEEAKRLLQEMRRGNATVPGESHPATTGEKIPRSR